MQILEFPHNPGHLVAFHNTEAFADGGILRQPVLHGIFYTVPADGIVIGIALGLQVQPGCPGGNRAGITDDLAGEVGTGIDTFGADFNAHTRQHH